MDGQGTDDQAENDQRSYSGLDQLPKECSPKKDPAPVVLLKSPTECWAAVIMTGLANKLTESQVESQVRSQVRSQVESQVRSQVDLQVESQVESQVRSQVRSQVESQVWSQVESQVRSQVESQVWSQVPDFVWPYFDCQFWASWFSFYEFIFNELGCDNPVKEKYEIFKQCSEYGMVFPLDSLCIVCQPPTILKTNSRGLHCEDGVAISYGGDNEIWALNGVAVPRELVMTEAESLSLDLFKNEKNADVKAEFVRKFGVERMLDMGKLIDSYENYDFVENEWWHHSKYELYNMGVLFGIEYQPYLKMVNQTTGIYHVEAVSPACRTLKDAIKERFGGRDMKIVKIA